MAGYGYGAPGSQPPYGSNPYAPPGQPYAAGPPPYGAPSAPYGAPSAPHAPPYAPGEKPPKEGKPHKYDQGGMAPPSAYPHKYDQGGMAPPSAYPHKYDQGGMTPPTAYPAPSSYSSPFAALLPSTFPPGTDPSLIACFQMADLDGSGFIDDKELQRALSSYNQSFSIRTVHLLMYLFTNSNLRRIGSRWYHGFIQILDP